MNPTLTCPVVILSPDQKDRLLPEVERLLNSPSALDCTDSLTGVAVA